MAKYEFMQKEPKFQGHVVSAQGIQVDAKKVQQVMTGLLARKFTRPGISWTSTVIQMILTR